VVYRTLQSEDAMMMMMMSCIVEC